MWFVVVPFVVQNIQHDVSKSDVWRAWTMVSVGGVFVCGRGTRTRAKRPTMTAEKYLAAEREQTKWLIFLCCYRLYGMKLAILIDFFILWFVGFLFALCSTGKFSDAQKTIYIEKDALESNAIGKIRSWKRINYLDERQPKWIIKTMICNFAIDFFVCVLDL